MSGTKEHPGISQRTMHEIFRVAKYGEERYEYTISCSLVEMYKQDLKDLLRSIESKTNDAKLAIRINKDGNVVVDGLYEKQCTSALVLKDYFDRGMAARKVSCTSMNSESSRSHLIFTIKVASVNRETGEKLLGKMSIIDLAGHHYQSWGPNQ